MASVCPPEIAPLELTIPDRPAFPALKDAFGFVIGHPLGVLLGSILVLIPCYWHHHIQATDLGSHVYNAWLAQLVQSGQAPGLQIVPQSSNVLFDVMLSSLFPVFGPVAAERIAVSVAVLIFFWGGFALCSAAAGHAAWRISPLLAMTCYGFMFNMGFFNLYLSVGLSLLALAILWSGRRWDLLAMVPLAALIWKAHLLGTCGLVVLGGFLIAVRRLPLRRQIIVTASTVVVYFVARWYLFHHFSILERENSLLFWMLGGEQFVLYGRLYAWVALGVMAVAAIILALSLHRDGRQGLLRAAVWLQIYAVMAIAVLFAPGGIDHPRLGMMGYLPDRASLYTAVLLCALLMALRPAKWQAVALGVVALAFFTLLYRDTGALDRLETKVEQAVAPLKPGQRIVANLLPPRSRIYVQHITDRACVGHCFFIANYEPASGQFRIKAAPGNRVIEGNQAAVVAMQRGVYRVQAQDLPLSEIYQCGPELNDICLHELQAGEYNGQAAYDAIVAFREKAQQSSLSR